MSQIDGLRRYLEAGLALGQITRARAEEAVRELISTGEVERARAQEWVEDLINTNKERYDAFLGTVRAEVRTQLADVGITNVDELARRVAKILEHGQAAARRAAKTPARKAKKTAKRAPAKKTTAKRSTAKKSTARKSTAKKSTAKKSTASKKTTSKRASGHSPASNTVTARIRVGD